MGRNAVSYKWTGGMKHRIFEMLPSTLYSGSSAVDRAPHSAQVLMVLYLSHVLRCKILRCLLVASVEIVFVYCGSCSSRLESYVCGIDFTAHLHTVTFYSVDPRCVVVLLHV